MTHIGQAALTVRDRSKAERRWHDARRIGGDEAGTTFGELGARRRPALLRGGRRRSKSGEQ